MAIKVLRRGDKAKEVSCHRCNARMEFDALEDVECINTACGYAGETWDPRYVLDCPECGERIYLDNKISEKAKYLAERRYHARMGQ